MNDPKGILTDKEKHTLKGMAGYWDEVSKREYIPTRHYSEEVAGVIQMIGYPKTLAVLRWFVASLDEPEPEPERRGGTDGTYGTKAGRRMS